MSIIKPFRALRPVADKAKIVSCVPYDVIYESEAREYIKENPLSFLRVTRSEADFPAEAKPPNEKVFARAKENLQKFIDEGILIRETEPCFYIYRLTAETHTQTGIVACCSLDEYESEKIKKHEKTRPDKVADRTAHIIGAEAQTGLIFLAFRNTPKIRELISAAVETEPIYDFPCANNVRHSIWRVAATGDLAAAFTEVPALYVADGHHRIESANLARTTLREENPEHTGTEDYNFVIAGIFPAEDLKIMAYNRVVKDLNSLSMEEFLEKVRGKFTVTETNAKVPENRHEFCMYLGGKWYKLKFAADAVDETDVIEKLDTSILQNKLLNPILGIDDPRTNERIIFVGGARGTDELEKFVNEQTAQVAFSLFPTTMDELFAVSDINEIMPPKSTWFEPKLKDGLLIHLI